ncbi:MAG: helix-turn-helix transcriptional regulator [Hyphomicrobiaceae bacterium]
MTKAQTSTRTTTILSAERIYTAREAAKLFSVSLATWNRYVAANRVPRPIRLGPRRIGWLESELAASQQAWRARRNMTAPR